MPRSWLPGSWLPRASTATRPGRRGGLLSQGDGGRASCRDPGCREAACREPPRRRGRAPCREAVHGDAAGLHAGKLVAETFQGDAGHGADPATIGDASSRRPGFMPRAWLPRSWLPGSWLPRASTATRPGRRGGLLSQGDAGHRSAAGDDRRGRRFEVADQPPDFCHPDSSGRRSAWLHAEILVAEKLVAETSRSSTATRATVRTRRRSATHRAGAIAAAITTGGPGCGVSAETRATG